MDMKDQVQDLLPLFEPQFAVSANKSAVHDAKTIAEQLVLDENEQNMYLVEDAAEVKVIESFDNRIDKPNDMNPQVPNTMHFGPKIVNFLDERCEDNLVTIADLGYFDEDPEQLLAHKDMEDE